MPHFEFYPLPPEARTRVIALKHEIAGAKFALALARMAILARKAGFDPNQPRVSAGDHHGGEWTNDFGNEGSSGDHTSEEAGSRTAANDTASGYPVDLLEEETLGGHTISEHVNRSSRDLLAVVRADQGQVGIVSYARMRAGSFPSITAANKLVNATLAQNSAIVMFVSRGIAPYALLKAKFDSKTGIEAYKPSMNGSPYLRDTYGVGVVIRHDASNKKGYRVLTAYPRND